MANLYAIVCSTALLLAAAPVAVAIAESNESVGAQGIQEARTQHRAAVQAFARGEYLRAVELFQLADRARPSAAFSYNIAKAYEALHDDVHALEFYREYLQRAPNAPDAQSVEARVSALTTPVVDVAGLPASSASASVAPEPVARTTTPAAPAHSPGGALRVAGFAALTAGAVSLGGAITFELLRASAEHNARLQREQVRFSQELETMQSRQTAARILAGTGAALAVVGGVLLLLSKGSRERPPSGTLALGCLPSRCTVNLLGAF